MTDFSSPLRDGAHLPSSYPKGKQYNREWVGISPWKAWKIIDRMILGIPKSIEDKVIGTIPAGRPLTLTQAARANGLLMKGVRRLAADADFQRAFREAVEAYRATLEPGNIAMGLQIRDDPASTAKERIRAGEFLRGPRPGWLAPR